jgi:hypothetical protein
MENKKIQTIYEFALYCKKVLKIQKMPKITLIGDKSWVLNRFSFGEYDNKAKSIVVYIKNRNLADVLRTVSHELIHHKQNEKGLLTPDSGKTGSNEENTANSYAGVIMRNYGKKNPHIYESLSKSKYKIYCDMDGVLVDFEKGYKDLTGVDLKGKHVSNSQEFWDPITKAGEKYWSELEWTADGKALWKYISKYNPEILSAPSKDISSKTGKHIWVDRELGNVNLILKSAYQKQQYAKENSILIDDRADNIQRWKDAGGIGIHHTSTENTIKELKKLGL